MEERNTKALNTQISFTKLVGMEWNRGVSFSFFKQNNPQTTPVMICMDNPTKAMPTDAVPAYRAMRFKTGVATVQMMANVLEKMNFSYAEIMEEKTIQIAGSITVDELSIFVYKVAFDGSQLSIRSVFKQAIIAE